MKAKTKCPACGAKNDANSRRCRLCTAVINADVPDPDEVTETPAPSGSSVLADHFDAGQLNREIQPAKSRFSSGGSGLGARIAAANGGQIPPTPTFASRTPDPEPEPTAPSIDHEEEPFDPEALFRDLDR